MEILVPRMTKTKETKVAIILFLLVFVLMVFLLFKGAPRGSTDATMEDIAVSEILQIGYDFFSEISPAIQRDREVVFQKEGTCERVVL
jgi:hypothetical protein